MPDRAILVCGATGKQGGAVITQLLASNADFVILAVTRNASSPSAKKLSEKSSKIRLVQGNLSETRALFDRAKEVAGPTAKLWGVFSVQMPVGFGQGKLNEAQQGKAVVDEAIKAGALFFVYSSVDRHGADSIHNPTQVPHFVSKHEIEHHLLARTAALPEGPERMRWCILRPTAFMGNLTDDFFGRVFVTAWRMALGDKPLQLVSVTDIGWFGAQAFLRPDEFEGRSLSLAGDELTAAQAAERFKAKTGREMSYTYEIFCKLLMWMVKDVGYMFQWFREVGYAADIAALREMHPGLLDFEGWLETESQFTAEV